MIVQECIIWMLLKLEMIIIKLIINPISFNFAVKLYYVLELRGMW